MRSRHLALPIATFPIQIYYKLTLLYNLIINKWAINIIKIIYIGFNLNVYAIKKNQYLRSKRFELMLPLCKSGCSTIKLTS